MALDNNYLLFPQQPLLDWDPHSFELGGLHDVESPMSSEVSTGYLQDAVAQWSEQWSDGCKRRRLDCSPRDPMLMTEDLQDIFQGFWNSNCHGDLLGNLNFFVEDNTTVSGGTNNNLHENSSSPPLLQHDFLSPPPPPPPSQKEPIFPHKISDMKDTHISSITTLKGLHIPLKDKGIHQQEKDKRKKVVYPFAVLKPVSLEGDVTLADINKRILMRPTRPVKHPVGEFAPRPAVSADGPGLSGKEVVGLTRIHTQGRGTITIIRTRG